MRFYLFHAVLLLMSSYSWAGTGIEKIDPLLMRTTPESFLVIQQQQADISIARSMRGKQNKNAWVVDQLRSVATRTQAPLLRELDAMGVSYRSFWVMNAVLVESSDHALIENLAQRADVAAIAGNRPMRADFPVTRQAAKRRGNATEWNIALTGAPSAWAMGFTGQGVVIAGQDTGYQWDHPALMQQYRGWNGLMAVHDHNWHDAIHEQGGICGSDSPFPCDDNNHGTHTMGIMAGDGGAGNIIGMAPGAQWIGCRNMDNGFGTPATYMECFQWFLAPTDLNGENPDPGQAPHVINNSWSCPTFEGCTDPLVLQTVVENERAAGIVEVVSAGNEGPFCESIREPASIYDASFSVASTTQDDFVSSFSSRGPVTIDGSGRLKPDIAAPGSLIRSSINGSGYGTFSGTSMAGPHVAGLVALIISANPDLAGEVDVIEQIIRDSALALVNGQDCGPFLAGSVPNAVFGHGRIRADEAVALALDLVKTDCTLYPTLLDLWPGPVGVQGDANANRHTDMADLVALGNCAE